VGRIVQKVAKGSEMKFQILQPKKAKTVNKNSSSITDEPTSNERINNNEDGNARER